MTAKKTKWKAPDGYVLARHEGTYVNNRGFGVKSRDAVTDARPLMADGAIEVLWFDEAEPFVESSNDGMGPHASDEAKRAARAGEPLTGWNPNVTSKPIRDGWMPPSYTLTKKGDLHVED